MLALCKRSEDLRFLHVMSEHLRQDPGTSILTDHAGTHKSTIEITGCNAILRVVEYVCKNVDDDAV